MCIRDRDGHDSPFCRDGTAPALSSWCPATLPQYRVDPSQYSLPPRLFACVALTDIVPMPVRAGDIIEGLR
eukprot:4551806-Pyramimonas_sp.AAC.1